MSGDSRETTAQARVAGVILAGGASTRMGRNKLLLDVGGESCVRRAARAAVGAGLAPVLVVVGRDPERVRAELEGLACVTILNPDPSGGVASSIRLGVAAVPPHAEGAVLSLGDMPLVDAAMIGALAARYRMTRAPLVVSDYGGVLAPPVLYSRRLFPELLALEGGGGKEVVARHRAEAVVVSFPGSALADLDDAADYERVCRALAARGGA